MTRLVFATAILSICLVLSGCDVIDRMDKQSRAYCFEQERYLSNEELHNIVIQYVIEQLNEHPPEWYDATDPNVIVYGSVEQFKKLNPSYDEEPIRLNDVEDGKRPGRAELSFYEAGTNAHVFRHGRRISIGVLKSAEDFKASRSFRYVITACGQIYGAKFNADGFSTGGRRNYEARQKYFGFERDK